MGELILGRCPGSGGSRVLGARTYLILLLFAKTYQQLQVLSGKILFDMAGCHEASLAQVETFSVLLTAVLDTNVHFNPAEG